MSENDKSPLDCFIEKCIYLWNNPLRYNSLEYFLIYVVLCFKRPRRLNKICRHYYPFVTLHLNPKIKRIKRIKYDDLEVKISKTYGHPLSWWWVLLIVVTLVFVCTIFLFIYLFYLYYTGEVTACINYVVEKILGFKAIILTFSERSLSALAALIGTTFAVITYIINRIITKNESNKKDKKDAVIYAAELEDTIRHLEANLMVLDSLLAAMKRGDCPRPAQVHFENLKIPDNSVIFTNKPMKLAKQTYINEFNRVSIKLRNINNSAKFLSDYSVSPVYHTDTMKQCIEWEIVRYVGYLMNFYYFVQDGCFQFPSKEKEKENDKTWWIDEFKENYDLVKHLSKLMVGKPEGRERTPDERKNAVETYIKQYEQDRKSERSVLYITGLRS